MIDAFYVERETALHRLPALVKLGGLFVLGSVLFLIDDPVPLGAVLAAVAVLYVVARVPAAVAFRQLRYAAILLGVIFLAQGWLAGWPVATVVLLRFASLLTAAALVSATTRTMAMVDAFETVLKPLALIGANPKRAGMALTLALRFIPAVVQAAEEVMEAQRARGGGRNVIALATPVIVRLLRMADEIADALDARGYGWERKS